MRYITIEEVEDFHNDLTLHTGGSYGIRDRGMLESAVHQPLLQFGGNDLYPDLVSKASALGYFLICDHPVVDGNKRIGLAAMQAVLLRNKFELSASPSNWSKKFCSSPLGNTR